MLMNPQDTGDIGELEASIALIKNGYVMRLLMTFMILFLLKKPIE